MAIEVTGLGSAEVLTHRIIHEMRSAWSAVAVWPDNDSDNDTVVERIVEASILAMGLTPLEFRKAMGCFATGVTIVTVDLDGEIHGMTANAFASVSLDPLLLLVCVDRNARTHVHLHAKKRFGINVLAEHQRAISEYYARVACSHEQAEEEAGARFDRTAKGTPMLRGALAYLECKLKSTQEAGDHTVFIAEVEDVVVAEGEPLLFFKGRYRNIGEEVADEIANE
jgi:flavin reductase (DIM6/NTAB) family NADH-FMN oxidoreductase RutF